MKSKIVLFILVILLLCSGCQRFKINENTLGKKIECVNGKYYLIKNKEAVEIKFKDKNKNVIFCEIVMVERSDKADAFVVKELPKRTLSGVISPFSKNSLHYLIVLQQNEIYSTRLKSLPLSIKWINKDLLVECNEEKLMIDKKLKKSFRL